MFSAQRATLHDYALPRLGEMPVDAIACADVMDVLLPIWFTKHNTACNVRQRIGAVMKWAVAQGHRADSLSAQHEFTVPCDLPNRFRNTVGSSTVRIR